MSEWISVEDRLPEVNVMVLIHDTAFAKSDKHDEKYSGCKRPRGVRFGFIRPQSERFSAEGCNADNCPITHWMPLPTPPKEKL